MTKYRIDKFHGSPLLFYRLRNKLEGQVWNINYYSPDEDAWELVAPGLNLKRVDSMVTRIDDLTRVYTYDFLRLLERRWLDIE